MSEILFAGAEASALTTVGALTVAPAEGEGAEMDWEAAALFSAQAAAKGAWMLLPTLLLPTTASAAGAAAAAAADGGFRFCRNEGVCAGALFPSKKLGIAGKGMTSIDLFFFFFVVVVCVCVFW